MPQGPPCSLSSQWLPSRLMSWRPLYSPRPQRFHKSLTSQCPLGSLGPQWPHRNLFSQDTPESPMPTHSLKKGEFSELATPCCYIYHEGSILRATVVKYSPSNPMLSHVQTEVGRIFMANVSALRRNIQGTCEVVEVESSGSEVPRTTFDSSSQKPSDTKDLSAKGSTCPSSEDSSGDPPLNKLVELACNEAAKDNTS